MEQINQLALAQEQIGKEIVRIHTNMKKDSPSIKNEPYLDKRSNNLQKQWDEAQQNHKKIIALNITDHSYFSQDYFSQIERCYQEADQYIMQLRSKLTEAQPRLSQLPWSTPQASSGSVNQQRELEVRIQQLNQSLDQAVRQLSESKRTTHYEALRDKIQKQWDNIDELHIKLQAQNVTSDKQDLAELEAHLEDVIDELNHRIHSNATTASQIQVHSQNLSLPLPPIQLPLFYGTYEDWPSFHDMFTKMVHSNQSLSNIEKMQYLKTHVRGAASRAIQHFSITDVN